MHRHRKTKRSSRRESDGISKEEPDKDAASRFGCRGESLPNERARRADKLARRRKIQKIRHEIQRGVYETEEKLAIAIDRLIDDTVRRRNR